MVLSEVDGCVLDEGCLLPDTLPDGWQDQATLQGSRGFFLVVSLIIRDTNPESFAVLRILVGGQRLAVLLVTHVEALVRIDKLTVSLGWRSVLLSVCWGLEKAGDRSCDRKRRDGSGWGSGHSGF